MKNVIFVITFVIKGFNANTKKFQLLEIITQTNKQIFVKTFKTSKLYVFLCTETLSGIVSFLGIFGLEWPFVTW